jgi:hypothetical protein
VPDTFDGFADRYGILVPHAKRPASVEVLRQDLAMETHVVRLERDASAGFELLARVHQAFPNLASVNSRLPFPNSQASVPGSWEWGVRRWEFAKEETLHCAAARDTTTYESGREHASVVEHEQIARAKMAPQPAERRVLNRSCVAWEDEESRLPSLGRRPLSDQFVGQLEIEVAGLQGDPGGDSMAVTRITPGVFL